MNLIKRYSFFLVTIFAISTLYIVNKEIGLKAATITLSSFKEMIMVIPPIFILLGLLDIWVSKEIMVKYMGEGSGIKGVLIAILIGSAAAVFMKKNVSFKNVVIFMGAWSTTKIPMFLFEVSSLGLKFALTRLIVDIFGIIIIAHVLSNLVSKEELKKLYINVEKF
jgi:uncharacterized membrane protein YraQ (UPF0718 family)